MARLHSLRIRSFEKPTFYRFFVTAAVAWFFFESAEVQGRGPMLTEQDVVAQVLARAPLSDAIEGAVAIEEGRGRAAGAYPNPQLLYMREQTFGPLGTGEDYLTLAQTFDLGNRRGLTGEAGSARAQAARSEGDASRLYVAADARLRFYEVLYRQDRTASLEAWMARIEKALTIVTRREQRGDAATYDRRRFERERAVVNSRVEVERAALERAQARLQALLGAETPLPPMSGALLPETDPAALPTLRASSSALPTLRALDLRIEAATRDRSAASRGWIPDLRIEGGWKAVDLGPMGRTDGFMLGGSLYLPLWDHGQGLARLADGEARVARGRRALLAAELHGELGGAHAEAARLRRAALEFRERTIAASADLVRIATAGYGGGELGLLELLDAYRGASDDGLTALDMAYAARRARIELDRMTGAALP